MKILRKYFPFLVFFLLLTLYSSELKQNFEQVIFKTESKNKIKLTISTNWFEFKDGMHNSIEIEKLIISINSGVIFKNYYFGKKRNERINKVTQIEWLKNDSLIVIHSKLINTQEKIDSLYWLKD
ncbi:hypothetical protein SAMN05444411_1342 [Lutibacter oricola]|uniref:Uncharacterized protein n=1 Tax=Lutibacter oricola TaxID=762486 RepID=A0A1H3HES1_9FLAO|nr:hypothetical protein [Lutibacter oricola]SDY13348.1 hypothetical protein SAMN05444411_1342 [Lutibacter oricola]